MKIIIRFCRYFRYLVHLEPRVRGRERSCVNPLASATETLSGATGGIFYTFLMFTWGRSGGVGVTNS